MRNAKKLCFEENTGWIYRARYGTSNRNRRWAHLSGIGHRTKNDRMPTSKYTIPPGTSPINLHTAPLLFLIFLMDEWTYLQLPTKVLLILRLTGKRLSEQLAAKEEDYLIWLSLSNIPRARRWAKELIKRSLDEMKLVLGLRAFLARSNRLFSSPTVYILRLRTFLVEHPTQSIKLPSYQLLARNS